MVGLEHYLILSAILFTIGIYGALSRRNLVAVLIGIEIMFNGVNVAMVAMSKFVVPAVLRDPAAAAPVTEAAVRTVLTGQVFALFIITVAAAEVALALAIVIAIYRNRETVDLSEISLMRR